MNNAAHAPVLFTLKSILPADHTIVSTGGEGKEGQKRA